MPTCHKTMYCIINHTPLDWLGRCPICDNCTGTKGPADVTASRRTAEQNQEEIESYDLAVRGLSFLKERKF